MTVSLSKLQEMVKGQQSLACYSPRGRKELDTIEQLNNKLVYILHNLKTNTCF